MPKKQRPLEHRRDARASGPESEGPTRRGPEGGNQAALEALGRTAGVGQMMSMSAAKSHAMSIVERGLMAVDVQSRDPDQQARFLQVLGESGLSPDRKTVLVERLTSEQDAAIQIEQLVSATFGDVTRASVELNNVFDHLNQLPGGPRSVSRDTWFEAEMSVALGPRAEAVTQFCHAVKMLLLLDEEEEALDDSIGALLEGE